jgi:hypothetical protein
LVGGWVVWVVWIGVVVVFVKPKGGAEKVVEGLSTSEHRVLL